MLGGDGAGPFGQGPGTGRGMGRGGGRRRMGRKGLGPGKYCICPNCGRRLPHQAGIPCNSINCPACGARMVRG